MYIERTASIKSQEILGGPEYKPYFEVNLFEDGKARAGTGEQHSSNNMTPMPVWEGRTLQWRNFLIQGSYAIADPAKIEAVLKEIEPLLKRVAAGHSVDWNGSNHTGKLTEEAQEASDEIDRIVSECAWARDDIQIWDARDYFAAEGYRAAAKQYGITPKTTPVEQANIEQQIKAEAEANQCRLINFDELFAAIQEDLKEEEG